MEDLYTTTRDDGVPEVASGIVVAPAGLPSGGPVVALAHGTTGVATGCAPSALAEPFTAGAFFVLDQVIANGWVLVAADYPGLGGPGPHPYLVGQPEGRSMLDAVRAARQIEGLDPGDETIVWGHSQGGHAALWTGILAPDYAPDVEVLGVAALAPASNLTGLVDNLAEIPGGALFAAYVAAGYVSAYDDVSWDIVRAPYRLILQEMASRCLAEPGVLVSILESFLLERPVWPGDSPSGPFAARLAENVPSGPIAAPLFVAQGEDDPLVLPTAQADYVAARCAAAGDLEYRTYPGRDHVGLVAADSALIPDLFAWTIDRLEGRPAASTC